MIFISILLFLAVKDSDQSGKPVGTWTACGKFLDLLTLEFRYLNEEQADELKRRIALFVKNKSANESKNFTVSISVNK